MHVLELLNKYDVQGMHQVYDKWPEISKYAYGNNNKIIKFKKIDHIVFAGMGGSGTLGDVFSSILSKTNIHVSVIKGYLLPKTVDSNTLVVTTSVSGNTVETLSILQLAKKKKSKIVAFFSSGKMEVYCKKYNINYIKVPFVHSPRASFTVYLYTMLKSLKLILPIKKSDITESIQNMHRVRKKIGSTNLTVTNPSLKLANWISGIPLIYYPHGLQATAIRFKNSLQENAKIHAMAEDVLESSHNGIVSWEKPSNVNPIIIRGKDDYIKTKERWQILKEYFKKNDIDYQEITSVKGSILSKIVTLIYFLDYCTIYKAVLTKTNPSPISAIDYVKEKL